jgi:hypothetical protein
MNCNYWNRKLEFLENQKNIVSNFLEKVKRLDQFINVSNKIILKRIQNRIGS